MLSQPQGVSLGEIIDATNWLPHTTRAALTVLRKQGFLVERFRGERLTTRYRIAAASEECRDGGAAAKPPVEGCAVNAADDDAEAL